MSAFAEYQRKRRARLRSEHKCRQCGQPEGAVPGWCDDHYWLQRSRSRSRKRVMRGMALDAPVSSRGRPGKIR